jgi:hypothetical protein
VNIFKESCPENRLWLENRELRGPLFQIYCRESGLAFVMQIILESHGYVAGKATPTVKCDSSPNV